jgi:hypothetical protein
MKRIIVTPAGRKEYLELLYKNLDKNKDEFDEWSIWVNTDNQNDIDYIEFLVKNNDYITSRYLSIPIDPNGSHTATICKFFEYCTDENSVYLRLDDDIVYIEKESIRKLFDFRLANENYFLVYGNILNNAIITHLYQQKGVCTNLPTVSYNCEDEYGWRNGHFAHSLHNVFFEKLSNGTLGDFKIDNWELKNFERCSINAISWLGSSFKKFNGEVGQSEETWLSTDKPRELNKTNIIFGDGLFVHYAFHPQRQFLQLTDTLTKYFNL